MPRIVERVMLMQWACHLTRVEELDGGPTLFQCFAVHHWGQLDFAFFGQKIGTVQRSGLPLGSVIGGPPRIATTFFPTGEIPVTLEKIIFCQTFGIFFRRNRPRYSYQNFTTYAPWIPI